jgi:hypothetical protein
MRDGHAESLPCGILLPATAEPTETPIP